MPQLAAKKLRSRALCCCMRLALWHVVTRCVCCEQKFPNWCTHLEEVPGDCGCAGPPPSEALQATFVNFTLNELGHLDHGVLQCPQEATDQWLMYHVPCSASSREKTAVIEMVRPAGTLHGSLSGRCHRQQLSLQCRAVYWPCMLRCTRHVAAVASELAAHHALLHATVRHVASSPRAPLPLSTCDMQLAGQRLLILCSRQVKGLCRRQTCNVHCCRCRSWQMR